ncbi:unnamed protein product [Closterium sp. NIES-65]|nr:unnamed protein product [Closterium sp. NIES-65]CAI6010428.1 unnamed protein product [Closterium sp. NIES-65]
MSSAARPRCFLDIAFDGQFVGRIEVEVRPDVAPKTVENFVGLCNGTSSGLGYKGLTLHRIIPGFMAQVRVAPQTASSSSASLLRLTWTAVTRKVVIDDGCACALVLPTNSLSMLASPPPLPTLSDCQFFICFTATPHLDGKHVVFGKVVSGMDVVDKLESVGSDSGKTSVEVTIQDCGQLV